MPTRKPCMSRHFSKILFKFCDKFWSQARKNKLSDVPWPGHGQYYNLIMTLPLGYQRLNIIIVPAIMPQIYSTVQSLLKKEQVAAYYEPCADRRSIESCWKSIATDIFPIACMSSTKLDVIRWSNDVHIDGPFLLKNFSCIGCFVIESDISSYFFHKIHFLLWASRRNDSTSIHLSELNNNAAQS